MLPPIHRDGNHNNKIVGNTEKLDPLHTADIWQECKNEAVALKNKLKIPLKIEHGVIM